MSVDVGDGVILSRGFSMVPLSILYIVVGFAVFFPVVRALAPAIFHVS